MAADNYWNNPISNWSWTPDGVDLTKLDLGVNSTFGSVDNYWNNPISNGTFDSMMSQFKPTPAFNTGVGATSLGSNLFGSLGSAFGKTAGSFGSSMSPLAGFNMPGTLAGMSAINATDEAKRREIDRYWYKLGDEEARRINARNYLGEGTLLDEAAGNLTTRNRTSDLKFGQYADAFQKNSNKFNATLAGKLGGLNSPYGLPGLNMPYG